MKFHLKSKSHIWTMGISVGILSHCGQMHSPSELKSETPTYVNVAGAAANILPGVGFDSARERAHDYCLEPVGALQTLPGTGAGKSVVFEFDKLTSDKTLTDKLNIATSMSVDYLMGGASAKFDFTKSHVASENSVTITVNSRVINSERTLGKVTLTKEAQKLYNSNPIAFYDLCGDAFVSGIRTGGEFHAVFEYKGLTSEEKQKIEASFSAHYLTMKADGHMTLENELLLKSSKLKVRIIQSGGDVVTSTSLEDFKAAAENFARSVTAVDANGKPGNSWAMEVTLKGYDKITVPSSANAKFTQLRAVRPIFLALVQKANRWEDFKSQLDYVVENTGEFVPFDAKEIEGYRGIAQKQLDTIKLAMDVCLENILKCTLPKLEDSSKIKIPKMKELKTELPQVVRIRLISNTGDHENKDKNRGYSFRLMNEQGAVVAQAIDVSRGEEYVDGSEHSIDIPLTTAFVPKGLFTARVDVQWDNDWDSRFRLQITYKDHDEVKVINTDQTQEYKFRNGANRTDWLITLNFN